MSRYSRAALFGCIIGLLGVVASLLTFVDECDQSIGLYALFSLRGHRPAPPETVIVSMDRESAQRLDIQRDPVKWPRAAHAEMLDVLKTGGARFIAFDILFDEHRAPRDDEKFAASILKAGNVILCGCTLSEHILLHGNERKVEGTVMIETFLPPIAPLATAALATASFPLPRMPARIDQCWSFKLGNTPTLPVVALQLYGIDVYDVFTGALAKGDLNGSGRLPKDKDSLLGQRRAQQAVRALRDLFLEHPSLGSTVLDTLKRSPEISENPAKTRLVHALLDMYTSEESRFINYYGPARTIKTIPYFKVIETLGDGLDFRGKAVFVGISEDFRAEQVGGFQTVFSGPEGTDLSSVELAATVFSNLLEGSSIETIDSRVQLLLLFAWGMLVGLVCRLMAVTRAVAAVSVLAAVYFGAAYYQFKFNYLWLPLFAPLLIQAPAALTAAIVTHYLGVKKEREDVRKAMGFYLPDDVIDHMVQNIADFKDKSDVVHGTVLFADAEKYSTLAENMEPAELNRFMNRYYEVLFTPVKKYQGRVLDVVGDAMLAIWYGESLNAETRSGPCRAALEMAAAVAAFNASADGPKLPVRIGLHSGHVSIGTVGAVDHYEYRAVGDCVNTASRLEGLNKYLKTRVLVSEDVIAGIDDFLTRPLGRFILAGKVNALAVHELIGERDKVHGGQFLLCDTFGRALEAYRKRLWSEAIGLFEEVLEMSPEDGPSRFYLMLCREFLVKPPPDGWEGSVSLASK
jgi:adenylate cyclase